MRKGTLVFLVAVLVVLSAGIFAWQASAPFPEGSKRGEEEKPRIVATLFPLYELGRQVGGERVSVSLLLPPGAEPHTFEPKPSDIVEINKADVFFYVGAGMEPWAHDIVEGAGNRKLLLVDASSKVSLLKSAEREEWHSHEHKAAEVERHSFEWAGLFGLKAGTYELSFSKVDGNYADPAMKMVILESDDLKSAKARAEELIASEPLEMAGGEALAPKETAYLLQFDGSKDETKFPVVIEKDGNYAFFTEHMPTEFEGKEHFFKDSGNNDVEPTVTEPETAERHRHHHGEYDPHFWLDFENYASLAIAFAEELSKVDKEGASYYAWRAEEYSQALRALDEKYSESLSGCKTRTFITGGHNAYAYLANKYNLTFHSAYGISPDSEPTPGKMKELVDEMRESGASHILFEELVSPRLAGAIAEETGAKILVFNPGHNLMKSELESGATFVSLMERNLESLKTALNCE